MPNFYPPFDPGDESGGSGANEAERAVLTALAKDLDDRWRVFHGFNWREADPKQGERIGEADLVVFHPDLGLLVIEVKGGGIKCVDGQWFYVGRYDGTEYPMKKSPFEQARRNRYHIFDRLKGTSLGPDFTADTTLTHTAWFPEITWTAAAPPEVPNGAFILDSRHLTNPASHLRNILRQANPHAKPWDDRRTGILVQSLSPDLNLLVPLGTRISGIRERILRMTEDQVAVSKMLRSQKRLLVEGCAGSGKTLLAAALARELTGKQKVAPENIAALSPYKPGHERVGLADFLKKERLFTTELAQAADGRVRIGTIQAFKGLEADVVILCGIDGHLPACSPANLYVGATRARSMLYVIHHQDFTEL